MKVILLNEIEANLILSKQELVIYNNALLNCLEELGFEFSARMGLELTEAKKVLDEIATIITKMESS